MYNFDTVIDRTGTGACKWVQRTDAEKQLGIIPMSVADMELPVAPCVRDAVVRAAEMGIYGYTMPTAEYFDALCNWMRRRHQIAITPEDVVPISGVVPAISVAIRAFTEPGDSVIVQSPVYHPFYHTTECNGRVIANCPLIQGDNGAYTMDFDALERAAKHPRTQLMLLCSPHNPVGRVWTREELMRVHEICHANDVLIVADEIHADLVKPGRHISFSTISLGARMGSLTFTAPSKSFNIPGLQNANALIFDPALRERFAAQAAIDGFDGVSYFGYAASIAAYNGAEDWLDEVLAYIEGNYELVKAFFAEHFPTVAIADLEGTYLAWIDLRSLNMDPHALQLFLREKAYLIVNDGAMFGAEGESFIRLNLAVPRPELKKALARLLEAWNKRA